MTRRYRLDKPAAGKVSPWLEGCESDTPKPVPGLIAFLNILYELVSNELRILR